MALIVFAVLYIGIETLAFIGLVRLTDELATMIWLLALLSLAGISLIPRYARGFDQDGLTRAMTSGGGLGSIIADRFAPLVGAFLLLLPGFFTGFVGLLLVIPFTRKLLMPAVKRFAFAAMGMAARRSGVQGFDPRAFEQMQDVMKQGGGPGGGMGGGMGGFANMRPEDMQRMAEMLQQGGGGGLDPRQLQEIQRRMQAGGGGGPGGRPPRPTRGGRKGASDLRDADYEVLDD